MNATHYTLVLKHQSAVITKRQAQCLFHLLHGKTAKETSKIIAISNRTVEVYLDQIRKKLWCQSKREIISKIDMLHFLTHYPF